MFFHRFVTRYKGQIEDTEAVRRVFSREIAEDKLTVTTKASVAPHTAVMYSELFKRFVETAEFEPEDYFASLCTMC